MTITTTELPQNSTARWPPIVPLSLALDGSDFTAEVLRDLLLRRTATVWILGAEELVCVANLIPCDRRGCATLTACERVRSIPKVD